jgi:DNA-binding MarR family transcriptional regulator
MAQRRHPQQRDAPLPAADAYERAFVNVIQLGDQFHKEDDTFLRPYGLTSAQYNVLRIVEGAGAPLAQRDIARRLLVSRANVTGLVDKLEAVGYVERCAVADRRVNLVRLTPQGRAFLHTTFAEQVAMCQAALAALSPADLQALLHLTTQLLQARQ